MLRGKKHIIQFYQDNGIPNIKDAKMKAMKPSYVENKHYHFLAQLSNLC